MLIIKTYRQGACTIIPVRFITVVPPEAPTWDEALYELATSGKEIAHGANPYKILLGADADGAEIRIGLFNDDTCYVTNEDGTTIEAIRPPKPKPSADEHIPLTPAEFDALPQAVHPKLTGKHFEPIDRIPQSPNKDG